MTDILIRSRADAIVRQEVLCCVSSLVSTLAQAYGSLKTPDGWGKETLSLTEQAMELSTSVPDYEETARQEGWELVGDEHGHECYKHEDHGILYANNWEDLCSEIELNDGHYLREVFEHWAVTDWLADKLIAHGEKVDKDFAGMCVWARTTTGQGIASDHIILQIAKEIEQS